MSLVWCQYCSKASIIIIATISSSAVYRHTVRPAVHDHFGQHTIRITASWIVTHLKQDDQHVASVFIHHWLHFLCLSIYIFRFVSISVARLINLLTPFLISFPGWYMVWKFFLCRFRLVRELFSLNSQPMDGKGTIDSGNRPRSSGNATGKVKPMKID